MYLEPRVRILPRPGDQSISEYETWIEMAIDAIKKEAATGSLKVTWLAPTRDEVICIVEWCIEK